MLTDTEKVDIRRHLGYPAYGAEGASSSAGWRFFQAYGFLEYKMQHLATAEETVLRTYLTQLNQLETDLYGTRENADTAEAAVWKRNPKEFAERTAIFDQWKARLSTFLGVPLHDGGTKSGSMRITV